MAGRGFAGRETPCGLDHHVDAQAGPCNRLRVLLLEDRYLTAVDAEALVGVDNFGIQTAEGGVVAKKVLVDIARDEVVDRDDFDAGGLPGLCLKGENGAQEIPPDPSKAVDADTNAHVHHLSHSRSFEAVSRPRGTGPFSLTYRAAPQNALIHQQSEFRPELGRVMFAKSRPAHVCEHERDVLGELTDREPSPVRQDDVGVDTVGAQ